MSGTAVRDAVVALRAAHDALAALPVESLTTAELLAALDELETLGCRLPVQCHRMLARLQTETTAKELGAKSWKEVLRIRWRLSAAEASRRMAEAAVLGPRRSLTGNPLPPVLEATAAAQQLGAITAEHVTTIREAVAATPSWLDVNTRGQFEVDLVRLAAGVGPKELKDAATKALFLLDQDGPVPDDAERQRKRGFHAGPQGRDGLIPITGNLNPEAWAVWEPIFAKFAAPGMCNPDDENPCTSGTPSQAHIDADARTVAQRRHDALIAVGRMALMSGELGRLNGLPVSIIIRTTLQDLESRAGVGTTGGGTTVPIADVIRLGGHANHFLAIFDRSTGSALELFRTRRIASPEQRIMLIARDGGCTKPCCPVGAYGSQVHHATADWINGGQTNVDEMALACGPDNRLVGDGGYRTIINEHGECEWIPPPGLDHGQTRTNHVHRPESLLRPPDDQPEVQCDTEIPGPRPPPGSAPG